MEPSTMFEAANDAAYAAVTAADGEFNQYSIEMLRIDIQKAVFQMLSDFQNEYISEQQNRMTDAAIERRKSAG